MPIKGLTNTAPSLPRVGALRKGGEKKQKQGKNGTYETWGDDLDHFRFTSDDPVVLSDFVNAYGNQPRTINVLLPYRTTDENFPTWKKEYSAGGLVHMCDGEFVTRYRDNKGQIVNVNHGEMPCPYESGTKKRTKQNPGCQNNARLNVIIPELKRFAIVEVHTSAINDIIHIDKLLRDFENRFGSLQGIPFTMTRVLEGISTPDGKGGRARRKKWMIHLVAQREWSALQLTGMQNESMPQLVSSSMPALASGESLDLETGEIVNDDDYHVGEYGERLDGAEPEPVIAPLPEKPTATQTKQFHATGKELYGNEWDTKRGELAKSVSGGLTTSSKHLTREEMQKLIDGMNAKKAA